MINWGLIEMKMKSNKLTNRKMAELLGIGIATWNRYRTGESDIPFKIFYKMLKILELNYIDIVDKEVF